MAWRYRGVTTGRLYSYLTNQLPTPTSTTVILNGEVCVPTNNDGALARGHKGPPAVQDPYSFTVIPSTWESITT